MATTRIKRPVTSRTNDVDRLAIRLGSSLKISDVPNSGTRTRKGTRIIQTTKTAVSPEESKAVAMKSINNVLQSLASSTRGKAAASRSAASSSATAGRSALNILRKLNPELVDTERAALSMVGKLLALNVCDAALDVLEDIRKHLPSLYLHAEDWTSNRAPLSLLQLPLPLSSLDATIQTCILTYLTHALSAVTPIVSTRSNLFDTFCDALEGPSCLRLWAPFLTALPCKTLDGLFKRAYVTLTTSFTSPPTPPLHILKIRFNALRILLLSTELDVNPFWEQCLKYAASYARSTEAAEDEGTKIEALLDCFASIDTVAEGRQEGKGWIAFCEYWLALSKRAGNMQTLNGVAAYIRNAASSSNDISQRITRSCMTLTQLAATLDQTAGNDDQLTSRADAAAFELRDLHASLSAGATLDSKLRRVVEKCRKGCLKALSRFLPGSSEKSAITRVLEDTIMFLERIVDVSAGTTAERVDATISSLDALFQLATAIFNPQRADTCDQAYDYLMRGLRIIERSPPNTFEEKRAIANYLRCLAGTFANLAGALYKAERHGIAIRFLMQACPLSTRASAVFAESGSEETSSGSEKDNSVWTAHRAQVYRRWELLGVCYVRTGDRRLAHDAFVQGVVTYPFEDEPSLSAIGSSELQASSPLVNAIDRLTHLAAVELRLDPMEVSLKESLRARGVPVSVVGAIVSRQAWSLSERSKPLVRTAVSALLVDILDVYDAARFPVRRVRTLMLVLEHSYYCSDRDVILNNFYPRDIIQEIEGLLSEKAGAGEDSTHIYLRPYYRAMSMLWAVLHAHRAADSTEDIQRYSQCALNALEALTAEPAIVADSKGRSVGQGRKTSTTVTIGGRSKSRTAPRAPPQASKFRATRSNSTRRSPAMAKSTNDVEANTDSNARAKIYELSVSERTSLAMLMLTVAELLDLSGLILAKIQFLIFVRRLSQDLGEPVNEVFLHASSMLAHLLLKLGKTSLASGILAPLASEVCESMFPSPAAVLLLLRYAELLALSGDVPKSLTIYENASQLSQNLPEEENSKGISAFLRVRSRVVSLERVATASSVFAAIQDAKNEPATSLKMLLQALRLLNRATETLARLNTSQQPEVLPDASDPFAMSDVKDALLAPDGITSKLNDVKTIAVRVSQPRTHLDGLEWRIANALLETHLALAQSYAARGSAREAEYFGQKAEELARVLGTSALTARALLQNSEVQMTLRNSDKVKRLLAEAKELMRNGRSLYEADVHRAVGDRLLLCSQEADAQGEFSEAANMLTEAHQTFCTFDALVLNRAKAEPEDAFAPVLQAKVLRQQVWLLRDELGENYERLLEQLFALPLLPHIEVHVNSILGRLALYDIHERFRVDMSLNSLAESTIALPMGMSCEQSNLHTPPQDIIDALEQADEHYVSDLSRFSERDSVINVRAAAVAAALVSAYQASLGITFGDSPSFASHLLDMASSITLRRELIDAIAFKFPNPRDQDDMRWPSASSHIVQRPQQHRKKPKGRSIFDDLSDDDDDHDSVDDDNLRKYWDFVLKKHQSEAFIQPEDSDCEIDSLPDNWMVISISLTDDKSTLLVVRQRPKHGPMVFCVPLKGRREDEEEGHFTFDHAMTELEDIIKSNDEGTRGASQIKSDDKEGKAAWWASRKQLDQRMKELVENIEFCWLGAFKTILSQPMRMPPDAISGLRTRFEKVFRNILRSHEKKNRKAKLRLETSLLELFATLPTSCRDEELQDLVYFVLDLYHFHGFSIPLAEVDIDVVVVDLRAALEEHHSRTRGRIVSETDTHTFLVLDKNVQAIPWESLPILRGCSVSRVPSTAFITDRLALVRCQRGLPLDPKEGSDGEDERIDRAPIDPSKVYYVLNPSGDLSGTERRFKDWVNDLRKVGWEGIVGRAPSEQQFLNALSRKDLVVYFGHGGAEQYARSHKIRHLQRCAATMLWGCSSGALRDMGDFDRIGTPNNYMLAGCPSLVANLWDVTDRDIDKFALSVFNKLRLEPAEVGKWQKGKRGLQDGKISIVSAVAQSRDVCKLKYLTGAAVVVYGIPYYL